MTTDPLLAAPTPTAQRARDIVAEVYSPALLHHCVRSYAFGVDLAASEGRAFDAELLFVAAMFHDAGLVPVFDSAAVDFEEAGGAIGRVFAAGAGWSAERRMRVHEIVVRHMWPRVDPEFDVEGYLLERATSLDVTGAAPDDWNTDIRRRIVEAAPRLGFATEFSACLLDQAQRKPESGAARWAGSSSPERAARNVLDD